MNEENIFFFLLSILSVSATLLGICVPAISIIYKFITGQDVDLKDAEKKLFKWGLNVVIVASIAFLLAIFLVIRILMCDVGWIWIPITSFVIGCVLLLITILIIGGIKLSQDLPTKKEPTEKI